MGLCSSTTTIPKKKSYLLQTLDDHERSILCAALSEDGSIMATGSDDRTARIWSTKTDLCECIGVFTGHESHIHTIAVQGAFLITGSADKTIRKWDTTSCACVHVFTGDDAFVKTLICTKNYIFASFVDHTTRCWDFDNGECIRVFKEHTMGVFSLVYISGEDFGEDNDDEAIDQDGNKELLITGSGDCTARSWSIETGKTIHVFKGHSAAVVCMVTDPPGKTLFTGSGDSTIRSWDVFKGQALMVLEGHGSTVFCLAIVGKFLYSGGSDCTARCWSTEFGCWLRIYEGHKQAVNCLTYHEGLVFTGCDDGIPRCFDARTATLKRNFKIIPQSNHPSSFALQIVDNRLFTGDSDGAVKVWAITGMKDDTSSNLE